MENFSYKELAEEYFRNKNQEDVLSYVKIKLNLNSCSTEIQEQLSNFVKVLKKRLKEVNYCKQKFYKKSANWLEYQLNVAGETAKLDKAGRPRKSLDNCSDRSKRRKLKNVNDEIGSRNIKESFLHQLRSQNQLTKVDIIEKVCNASPVRTKRIVKSIPTPSDAEEYTNEEALALFLDLKLTKQQYIQLRLSAIEKGSNLYPAYHHITAAKMDCLPSKDTITITPISAEVQLQSLLDHTAERLLQSITGNELKKYGNTKVILFCKWGCDGSSGQKQYKQVVCENISDSDMFMVSFVPLRLKKILEDSEPSTSTTQTMDIWKNETPSSTKYCRPIKFEFKKETHDAINKEVSDIKAQIATLQPLQLQLDGQQIEVSYQLVLTMIDGKVGQALTNTKAASSCIICQATSTQLNQVPTKSFVNTDAFEFGLSPLHARIRLMEHILKISYDLDFGPSGSIRNNETNKELRSSKKKHVQDEYRKFGLIIDQPKQGSGNTNDGNTARRFFSDPETASEITGVDLNLIFRFKIILEVLACNEEIDSRKFGDYAKETAKIYTTNYPWRNMSATVHKILYHGEDVIKYHLVPLGDLSEEAQEKRNKDYRFYREHNTRKMSRNSTNEDLFNILLATSDPFISSIRNQWKVEHRDLDEEAKKLLKNRNSTEQNMEYLQSIFESNE